MSDDRQKLRTLVTERELSKGEGPFLNLETAVLCVWHGDQGYEIRPGADGVLEIEPVDEDGVRPRVVLHPRKNGVGVGVGSGVGVGARALW